MKGSIFRIKDIKRVYSLSNPLFTERKLFAPLMIQSSPVESHVINKRSSGSQARPAGRKQPLEHVALSPFIITLTATVVLVDGSAGWLFLYAILLRRYPFGGCRSLYQISSSSWFLFHYALGRWKVIGENILASVECK